MRWRHLHKKSAVITSSYAKYEKDVETAMVAANNHYAGFGPETSNMFREMLGLKSWIENQ